MDCDGTRACPRSAEMRAASRVDPTCGVKPGNDASGKTAQTHGRHFFFFWYMPSMRCVTKKPPKMLTDAKLSAMKPKTRAQIGPASLLTSATPTPSNAPTTMTDEIAFVTDISGVCKAGVTDHTT